LVYAKVELILDGAAARVLVKFKQNPEMKFGRGKSVGWGIEKSFAFAYWLRKTTW
jgi:hypothetical protein